MDRKYTNLIVSFKTDEEGNLIVALPYQSRGELLQYYLDRIMKQNDQMGLDDSGEPLQGK